MTYSCHQVSTIACSHKIACIIFPVKKAWIVQRTDAVFSGNTSLDGRNISPPLVKYVESGPNGRTYAWPTPSDTDRATLIGYPFRFRPFIWVLIKDFSRKSLSVSVRNVSILLCYVWCDQGSSIVWGKFGSPSVDQAPKSNCVRFTRIGILHASGKEEILWASLTLCFIDYKHNP